MVPPLVGQGLRLAAAHRGHERIRGPQVDADGKPVLVRCRGFTGLGYL
jgi:hypothetical protein